MPGLLGVLLGLPVHCGAGVGVGCPVADEAVGVGDEALEGHGATAPTGSYTTDTGFSDTHQ